MDQLEMDQVILKLKDYQGRIVSTWKTPNTRRQLLMSIRKLLKFYYRAEKSGVLTSSLLDLLQNVSKKLLELSHLRIFDNRYRHYTQELVRINSIEFDNSLFFEIIEEKIRRHEDARCSFCKVKLIYPAYVITKQAGQIISRSRPIGIFCLNQNIGRLKDLIISLDFIIKQETNNV